VPIGLLLGWLSPSYFVDVVAKLTRAYRFISRVQWDVDRYQTSHSFVWKYGSSLLELVDVDALYKLATKVGSSETSTPAIRALDVGCGSGQLTKLLHDEITERVSAKPGASDAALQVFGMDLDPDMIAAAQAQFPEIRFFVGDARNVRLPSFQNVAETPQDDEPSVHLILSNAALHWIPPLDIDRAMQAICRALVPGGQFVVEFGGRGNVKSIVKAMKQVFPPPSPPATLVDHTKPGSSIYHDEHVDTWYYPSIADFAGRLASNKIEVTSAALFDRPTLLDNGEDGMENWIRMFGSKYWRHLGLSQDEIDERILQAVELLRPQLYDPATGQWTADYRRIRIVGRKLE
jgi:SAM-dependent methyltransferase